MNPNQHPNTILTLSAHTALDRGDALTPDQRPFGAFAAARLRKTREIIERRIWLARVEVIREQLTAMRQTLA